jgi:hypothetical protein
MKAATIFNFAILFKAEFKSKLKQPDLSRSKQMSEGED